MALFSVVSTVSIWYNFLAYNVVASIILTKSALHLGVLLSFTTIFVAFIARPIGAYVFGIIGDKFSSKASLVLTLIIMGVSTLLISIIERTWYTAYELIVLRIAQGLSIGGEWASASILTYESVRGSVGRFLTSLIQLGVPLGMLLTAFAVINWRLALLMGSLLSLSSAIIILALAEGAKPINWRPTLRIEDAWKVVRAIGVKFGESSSFYVYTSVLLIYFNEYGISNLIIAATISLLIFTLITSAVMTRAGPVKVLVLGYVIFALINALMFRVQPLLLFILFGIADALAYTPPQSLYLVSLFRSDIRHVSSGVSYHIASSLGGLINYLLSILISVYGLNTGFIAIPASLIMSCVISIITLLI